MAYHIFNDLEVSGAIATLMGDVISSAASMPAAGSENKGQIVIYIGDSSADCTKGTVYESTGSAWTAIGTISDKSNVLSAENASVSWAADASVSGYSYKGTISLAGCTADHMPIVSFGHDAVLSGDYYPIAESAADKIYVWAKTNASVTVDVAAIL